MVNVESGLKEDVCFLNKYELNSSSRRAVGFFFLGLPQQQHV